MYLNFAFVAVSLWCLGDGIKMRREDAQAEAQDKFTNAMDWYGQKMNRFEVEIEPGEQSYEDEKEYADQLVGDGIGEPNYFLTDGPFLPEELAMVEANLFLPEIFPHYAERYSEHAHAPERVV